MSLGTKSQPGHLAQQKAGGQLSACFVVVVVVITGEDTDKWLPGRHHVLARV